MNNNYNGIQYILEFNCGVSSFGFECVFNFRKEAIIIIIGGYTPPHYSSECKKKRDVITYNCVTHHTTTYPQVAFSIYCKFRNKML